METEGIKIAVNKFQTPINKDLLDPLPKEVQEKFLEYVSSIEYIRRLISPERKYARDLPRDSQGRIIVDLTHPHILENMDYFRPAAIHFEKYGCYTNLRPNYNHNSEFYKWISEEVRRCWEGYVRPSDGEWITGPMYYFMNYTQMELTEIHGDDKTGSRVTKFPQMWEGIYLRNHYLYQAEQAAKQAAELSARGKGKSYTISSFMSRNFTVGHSQKSSTNVKSVLVAYLKEFLTKEGTINKFTADIDFAAKYTQFPRRRLKDSQQDMTWIMGYKDAEIGVERGTKNTVLGVAIKDEVGKIRGKRAQNIFIEEFGTFPKLVSVYNVMKPSVTDGNIVFGQIYMLGCVCAGTKVWTLDGRNINIEDLKKEDGIIGYSKLPVIKDNYVIHNNGITRESIGKVIEPVEKDCVKITLSNGNTLMCSTDHPIFVQTKSSRRLCSYKDGNRRKTIFNESFVRANQLKVGDRICECRKIDVFGNSTLFDSRLVGMLIGDGSYGNNETPKYSSEDRELLEWLCAELAKIL